MLKLSEGVKLWFILTHIIVGILCISSLCIAMITNSEFFTMVFIYSYPVIFITSLISVVRPKWILFKEYKK